MGKHEEELSPVASETGRTSLRVRQKPNYCIPGPLELDDSFEKRAKTSSKTAKGSGSRTKSNDADEAAEKGGGTADDEEGEIRCVCLQSGENGSNWVQCDLCKVWQHQNCVGLEGKRLTKHKNYYCERCRPIDHPYFQRASKLPTSKSPQVPSAKPNTPGRKRNTINSMDSTESFATTNEEALNPDSPKSMDSIPDSSEKGSNRVNTESKKRIRDSGDECDDPPVKRERTLKQTEPETTEPEPIRPTTTKTSKARSKKATGVPADTERSRQASPSVSGSFRGSPSIGSPLVPSNDFLAIPQTHQDPSETAESPINHSIQTPTISSFSLFAAPEPSGMNGVVMAKDQLHNKATSKVLARHMNKSNCPPSPSISIVNTVQEVSPPDSFQSKPISHRMPMLDIKRRVNQMAEYLRHVETSDFFQGKDGRRSCQCSSISAKLELSSAASDHSDCSLLTPPLSTTSPTPIFGSLAKSTSGIGPEPDVVVGSLVPTKEFDSTKFAVCDVCHGLEGEESSTTILLRLREKLREFSNQFGI
ncbi:hypothetical protein HDU79_008175 [Rhizoclosmatium sp. JEL0117]|nr:hypothetical protein HDU79_008175 [Rhizoclosmatium sp. JEL0117]